MIVIITNLTDAPGKSPTQLDVYNRILDPGSNLKLPADLVNSKIRALQDSGLIAIGQLPPWYVAAKKKKSRVLTEEEKQAKILAPVIALEPEAKAKSSGPVKGRPMLAAALDEVQDFVKSTKG